MPGLEIGTNINGENLSEKKFFPFYKAAEELGCALFIHPWEMMGEDTNAEILAALAGGHAGRNFKSYLFNDFWRRI